MLSTKRHQQLAHAVVLAPALDRGDRVLGRDGLAVVPQQAVAQREGVGQVVVADLVAVDHLRLDLEILVQREQRIVDHIAVVAADIGRGPDRIDDLQIGMHHHAQRVLLSAGRRRARHEQRHRQHRPQQPGRRPCQLDHRSPSRLRGPLNVGCGSGLPHKGMQIRCPGDRRRSRSVDQNAGLGKDRPGGRKRCIASAAFTPHSSKLVEERLGVREAESARGRMLERKT